MSEDTFENPFSLTTNEPSKCEHKIETPEKRRTREEHFRPFNADEMVSYTNGMSARGLGGVQTHNEIQKTSGEQKFIV